MSCHCSWIQSVNSSMFQDTSVSVIVQRPQVSGFNLIGPSLSVCFCSFTPSFSVSLFQNPRCLSVCHCFRTTSVLASLFQAPKCHFTRTPSIGMLFLNPKCQYVIVLGHQVALCHCSRTSHESVLLLFWDTYMSLFSDSKCQCSRTQVSMCHCSGTPSVSVSLFQDPQMSVCLVVRSEVSLCHCSMTPNVHVSLLWDPKCLSVILVPPSVNE